MSWEIQLMHPENRSRGERAIPLRLRAVDHVNIPRVLSKPQHGVILVDEHR